MNERTWRCTECRHFVFPNYCAVKEINVDRNYDGYCDLAEELEEDVASTLESLTAEPVRCTGTGMHDGRTEQCECEYGGKTNTKER